MSLTQIKVFLLMLSLFVGFSQAAQAGPAVEYGVRLVFVSPAYRPEFGDDVSREVNSDFNRFRDGVQAELGANSRVSVNTAESHSSRIVFTVDQKIKVAFAESSFGINVIVDPIGLRDLVENQAVYEEFVFGLPRRLGFTPAQTWAGSISARFPTELIQSTNVRSRKALVDVVAHFNNYFDIIKAGANFDEVAANPLRRQPKEVVDRFNQWVTQPEADPFTRSLNATAADYISGLRSTVYRNSFAAPAAQAGARGDFAASQFIQVEMLRQTSALELQGYRSPGTAAEMVAHLKVVNREIKGSLKLTQASKNPLPRELIPVDAGSKLIQRMYKAHNASVECGLSISSYY